VEVGDCIDRTPGREAMRQLESEKKELDVVTF